MYCVRIHSFEMKKDNCSLGANASGLRLACFSRSSSAKRFIRQHAADVVYIQGGKIFVLLPRVHVPYDVTHSTKTMSPCSTKEKTRESFD
jgi:hypothetical protein